MYFYSDPILLGTAIFSHGFVREHFEYFTVGRKNDIPFLLALIAEVNNIFCATKFS